jgi:hypothetical protein
MKRKNSVQFSFKARAGDHMLHTTKRLDSGKELVEGITRIFAEMNGTVSPDDADHAWINLSFTVTLDENGEPIIDDSDADDEEP